MQLPNGAVVNVEVSSTGREDVGFDVKQFQPVADGIEGVVQMIATNAGQNRLPFTRSKFEQIGDARSRSTLLLTVLHPYYPPPPNFTDRTAFA